MKYSWVTYRISYSVVVLDNGLPVSVFTGKFKQTCRDLAETVRARLRRLDFSKDQIRAVANAAHLLTIRPTQDRAEALCEAWNTAQDGWEEPVTLHFVRSYKEIKRVPYEDWVVSKDGRFIETFKSRSNAVCVANIKQGVVSSGNERIPR